MKLLTSIALALSTVLLVPGVVPQADAAAVVAREMHQSTRITASRPAMMTLIRRGPDVFLKCCSQCEAHQKYCWQRCKKGC